jgi:hypothetical protein
MKSTNARNGQDGIGIRKARALIVRQAVQGV